MEKKKFALLMRNTAMAIRKYAPDFSDMENLRVWYDHLKDIPDSKLEEACNFAIQNMTEFPSIALLIRTSKGTTQSDEENGRDVATRIETAVGKYGYINTAAAQEYVGELGWEVVRQCGGWINVCAIETMDELPSLRKRWREIGQLVSKKFHTYGEDIAPSLPASNFSALNYLKIVR